MLYYKPLTVYSSTTKMREETLKITIFNLLDKIWMVELLDLKNVLYVQKF